MMKRPPLLFVVVTVSLLAGFAWAFKAAYDIDNGPHYDRPGYAFTHPFPMGACKDAPMSVVVAEPLEKKEGQIRVKTVVTENFFCDGNILLPKGSLVGFTVEKDGLLARMAVLIDSGIVIQFPTIAR